jgi:uncharacterized protein YabE (DUF348 family)
VRRTPLAIALYTSVLATLGGATVAFAALDKTVTVDVDGTTRHVRTFAGHVGDTLERAGIPIGAHDAVAPDASAPVRDGSRIVVRHGRELTLSLNGKQRTVWVTALSVDEALDQLGLRAGGAWVSASRSQSIGRDGLSLAVRTPQRVTVLADGRRSVRMTTAPTVRDFLTEIHLRLGRTDKVSVPMTVYPTSGTVVQVTRISHSVIRASEAIPFRTITRGTSELYQGQSKVTDEGTAGLRQLTWRIVWRDGKIASKTLVTSRLIASPHPRIVYEGTKVRPAPPTHSPSADGLNWGALANCESGGNPRAVSSGGDYRGLYQFTMGTWASVGGSGDPIDASPSEQTYRAQILFNREGTSPWPVCGHYLYS